MSESLQRIARLLYVFTKVRGYKTISELARPLRRSLSR